MENQRIRITKQMLKSALIHMLQETDIGKIRINALCDEAQINRTTFYKYYGSQYDVLEEIECDILNEIAVYVREKEGTEESSLVKLLQYLLKNKECCLVLISVKKNEFSNRIFNLDELEFMNQRFKEAGTDERHWKFIRNFVYSGCYSIIIDWLSAEQPESCEMIANFIIEMVTRCMGISKKELTG